MHYILLLGCRPLSRHRLSKRADSIRSRVGTHFIIVCIQCIPNGRRLLPSRRRQARAAARESCSAHQRRFNHFGSQLHGSTTATVVLLQTESRYARGHHLLQAHRVRLATGSSPQTKCSARSFPARSSPTFVRDTTILSKTPISK